jgi:gliding motility-associated-like protein
MKIYNRWGELLFESSDPSMGWDGTYLGNALDAGAYTYVIRFITTEDARFRTFSGIVFLMK